MAGPVPPAFAADPLFGKHLSPLTDNVHPADYPNFASDHFVLNVYFVINWSYNSGGIGIFGWYPIFGWYLRFLLVVGTVVRRLHLHPSGEYSECVAQ